MQEIDSLASQLEFNQIPTSVFIERSLEIICRRVDCSRSGLWLFSHSEERRRILRCAGMYDRRDDRMIKSATSWADIDEAYFNELAIRGKVVADNVQAHVVTARHFETYFRAQDIRSFLAVACSLNGRICGAFTCSQIGSASVWSGTQIRILSMLGARATIALSEQFPATGDAIADNDEAELASDQVVQESS